MNSADSGGYTLLSTLLVAACQSCSVLGSMLTTFRFIFLKPMASVLVNWTNEWLQAPKEYRSRDLI
jgi:hypothetical protein